MERSWRSVRGENNGSVVGWPKVWLMTVKEDQSEKDVFSSCVELPICKLNVNRESDLIRLRVCS